MARFSSSRVGVGLATMVVVRLRRATTIADFMLIDMVLDTRKNVHCLEPVKLEGVKLSKECVLSRRAEVGKPFTGTSSCYVLSSLL